jgi:hypothetical protein
MRCFAERRLDFEGYWSLPKFGTMPSQKVSQTKVEGRPSFEGAGVRSAFEMDLGD